MARTFVAASSQFLSSTSVPVSGPPMSVAAWVRPSSALLNKTVVGIGSSTVTGDYIALFYRAADTDKPRFDHYDGTNINSALCGVGVTNGAWNHVAGVIYAATSLAVFLNGGNKATAATATVGALAVNRFEIGRLTFDGTPDQYFNGDIAEVGIWNAALDDAEIASLAKGFCPKLIRPQSLVSYFPLFANDATELDRWKNGTNLTVTGATKAAHPPIFYPQGLTG